MLDTDDCRQSFPGVIAGEVRIRILEQAGLTGIVIDRACHRRPQPCQVRAAINRVDGIGEGINGFGIGVGVLQCHLNAGTF